MASIRTSGRPGVFTQLENQAQFPAPERAERVALLGNFTRGPIDAMEIVASETALARIYGTPLAGTDSYLYAVRALRSGANLRIGRIVGLDADGRPDGTTASIDAPHSTPNLAITGRFQARSQGRWANDVSVAVVAPASGRSNVFDITIKRTGEAGLDTTILDFPAEPTEADRNSLEVQQPFVSLIPAQAGGTIELVALAETALAGGQDGTTANDRDVDAVDADYLGSQDEGTGIYAMDKYEDITRAMIPAYHSVAVNLALQDYAESREDIMALLRPPLEQTADNLVLYSNGTGGGNTTRQFSSIYASLFAGRILVIDPSDDARKWISPIADVAGLLSRKDTDPNRGRAGATTAYSRVEGVLQLDPIFSAVGANSEQDRIYNANVNYFTNREGVVRLNGNRTLDREAQNTRQLNIVELLIYISRQLREIARGFQFEPNVPETWTNIQSEAVAFLENLLSATAIVSYEYNGDASAAADLTSGLSINNIDDINRGVYVIEVVVRLSASAEYVSIRVVNRLAGS